MKHWVILSNDGLMEIAVPQCDTDWANIHIGYANTRRYKPRGSVSHRVSIPDMKFEKKQFKIFDMCDEVYAEHLLQNKQAILQLIERLNQQ